MELLPDSSRLEPKPPFYADIERSPDRGPDTHGTEAKEWETSKSWKKQFRAPNRYGLTSIPKAAAFRYASRGVDAEALSPELHHYSTEQLVVESAQRFLEPIVRIQRNWKLVSARFGKHLERQAHLFFKKKPALYGKRLVYLAQSRHPRLRRAKKLRQRRARLSHPHSEPKPVDPTNLRSALKKPSAEAVLPKLKKTAILVDTPQIRLISPLGTPSHTRVEKTEPVIIVKYTPSLRRDRLPLVFKPPTIVLFSEGTGSGDEPSGGKQPRGRKRQREINEEDNEEEFQSEATGSSLRTESVEVLPHAGNVDPPEGQVEQGMVTTAKAAAKSSTMTTILAHLEGTRQLPGQIAAIATRRIRSLFERRPQDDETRNSRVKRRKLSGEDDPSPDGPMPDAPAKDEPTGDEATPEEPSPEGSLTEEPSPEEPRPDEPTPGETTADEPRTDYDQLATLDKSDEVALTPENARQVWTSPEELAPLGDGICELLALLSSIYSDIDHNFDGSKEPKTPTTTFIAGDSFVPCLRSLVYTDEKTPPLDGISYSERRLLLCRAIKKAESVLPRLYTTFVLSIKTAQPTPTNNILPELFSRTAQGDFRFLRSFLSKLSDICQETISPQSFPDTTLEVVLKDLDALANNRLMPSLYRLVLSAPRETPATSATTPTPVTQITDPKPPATPITPITITLPGSFPVEEDEEEEKDVGTETETGDASKESERQRPCNHAPPFQQKPPSDEAIRSRLSTKTRVQLITARARRIGKRYQALPRRTFDVRTQTDFGREASPALVRPIQQAGSKEAAAPRPLIDQRTRIRLYQESQKKIRKSSKPHRSLLECQLYRAANAQFNGGDPGEPDKVVLASSQEALAFLWRSGRNKSTRSIGTPAPDPKDLLSCFSWCRTDHEGQTHPSETPADDLPSVVESFEELKVSDLISDRQRQEREEEERKKELERQRAEQERQLQEEERRRAEEQRLREEYELAQRLRAEQEARSQGRLRAPNRPLFPQLSPDWSARVHDSYSKHSQGAIAKSLEADLLQHDFARLVPPTVWLNDSVVNGSLLWLDKFINEAAGVADVKAQTRKCLVLGSFFYKRLNDQGVTQTERTLRRHGVSKNNFLDMEIILMPVCEGNHWTLMVIHPKRRTIAHVDSLNPRGSEARMALVQRWIKTVLGDLFVESEWHFAKYPTPEQTNGYDCGVHTILNGMCLALGVDPLQTYSANELPTHRENIAAVLLNSGFRNEFSLAEC